jgi:hypothetical protein
MKLNESTDHSESKLIETDEVKEPNSPTENIA